MLTAHLLGRFSLRDDKGRDVSPRSRKARGLLGYLMVSDVASERREKLAGLLWSESSIEQAYDSLRHSIAELRRLEQTTGVVFLHADRQSVMIDRSHVQSDLADLKTHLAASRIAECRHLLTLPDLTLMPGAEADDPAFDNWLLVERERQSETLVHDMLALLSIRVLSARDRADLARAIERLDPYQEDAVRVHMEYLAAEGNIAGAAAYFESYRNRLLREYEVEPSEELIELAETLAARADPAEIRPSQSSRSDRPGAADSAGRGPSPIGAPLAGDERPESRTGRAPTIALLRSAPVSGADRLEQLTQAFCHELISTLCRFKEWTVVAAGPEPMIFDSGARDSLSDLAAMSVDYALLTSISDVAGSTVINMRLSECRSRSVLISDQYPADSDNWPSVFNDICCRVASRTQVSIAAARLRNVAGRSSEQRQAYDVWLEGEVLSRLWTPEAEERAVKLFQRALTLDDQLACAYGSWAAALNTRWIISPGWPRDAADRQQAYELAKRAVTLDPLDCRNHMHLGWSHLLARRFEPGELHFQMAHDLNPSNPDNLLVCGLANALCGHHEKAKALCDRAATLNPFRPMHYWGYRASVELLGRNFAACIAAVSRAPDMYPDIQGWAAVAHAHLGQISEARAALEQFYADVRKHWVGEREPTEQELRKWFAEIFPIKLEEDRRLLADGLAKIA